MTSKVNAGKFSYQYGYDLRNRLASANITRKEGLQDVTITSSYAYNMAGIRTRAEQTINGVTQNRYFLLDSGHTGYAQVFEETSTLGGNVVRSYVLGDDVLSQNVGGVTSHLLYDGHGSTRQLTGDDGAVTANYAYDAYGKMLGGNPNVTDRQSATDLLYAGEQFDPGLQMEYLRARYYDQDNGRFNRLDPFDGNSEDPQSLHKYAYAHCDPVNGIDPSGEFLDILFAAAYSVNMRTADMHRINAMRHMARLSLVLIQGIMGGTMNLYTNLHADPKNSKIKDSHAFLIGFISAAIPQLAAFYSPKLFGGAVQSSVESFMLSSLTELVKEGDGKFSRDFWIEASFSVGSAALIGKVMGGRAEPGSNLEAVGVFVVDTIINTFITLSTAIITSIADFIN